MASTMDQDAQFTGKYEEAGRIGTLLLDRFYRDVLELLVPAVRPGARVVEVGCGAGFSTQRIAAAIPGDVELIGSDIGDSLLEKARRRNPQITFLRQSAYSLPFPDKSLDAVVMLEVLEHLDEPSRALSELQRVCRGTLVLSVPREPMWRVLNMCRGKYLADFGNTPGHVNHWSSRGLTRAVRPWFEVDAVRQPLPWTVVRLHPKT